MTAADPKPSSVAAVLSGALRPSAILLCLIAWLGTGHAQEQNLVENGGFELRTPDGWVEGWERVLLTADCKVEPAQAEGGNPAIKVAGGTKKSKGGLKARLGPFEGPPVFRVSLLYRGTKGQRYVIIRREGTAEEGEEALEERIPLEPSQTWRPGGEMVSLPAVSDEEPGEFSIELVHEGPGETWFDKVSVVAGEPTPRPAQPTGAVAGPYATRYSPDDGSVVSVNPPRMRWPGRPRATYTLQLSTSPDFPPAETQRTEDLDLNLYIPAEPLAAGTWYWRVTETTGAMPEAPIPGLLDDEEGLGEEWDDMEPPEGEGDEAGIDEPPDEDLAPDEEPEPEDEEPPSKPQRKKGRRKPKAPSPDGPEGDLPMSLEPEPQGPSGAQADPPEAPEDDMEPPAAPGELWPPEDTDELPGLPGDIELPGLPMERPHAPEPRETVSATRSFRIDDSAAVVPVPPVVVVVDDLGPHPRVWLTADSVAGLRTLIQGPLKAHWDRLAARLAQVQGGELPEEPMGRGKWRKPSPKQLAANEEILRVAASEAGLVRDFAFASLVTGEEGYAAEAKRRALHLASWDAEGATGYASHDQAFREILLALALAVDWLDRSLSEEDRPKLAEAISARGETLYKALSEGPRPLNFFPYSSHGQTALGFLTIAALATVGEVPEAEEWLGFALPTAVSLFSPWAGDDGGWRQGETYWKRSAPYTFQLLDALRTAADIDLYAMPWAENTARYKVYMHPPYSTRGGFGDGPEVPPDVADRLAMLRLASARDDALAAWYAASIDSPEPEPTAFDILWRDRDVAPGPPDSLPPSASFPDSGLFAMHSSLADARGIHLYGRASSFGSFNHAHADQNHFSLHAFGQPLLIDAGYYDWYRSPHGTSFSRTSLAHNTLLVNGKIGQRVGDITAEGKIETFLSSPHFDYAVTEASSAYPRAVLKAFRRHFVFSRPNCIVVWDQVEASQKASFTWLLHSLQEPALDQEASSAIVRQAEAGLAIGAFGPDNLVWKATSRFPKNPKFTEQDVEAPPQWHTSVTSKGKAETQDLLLVLAPFEGEAAPSVEAVEVAGGKGAEARVGDSQIIAAVRVGEADAVSWTDLAAAAEFVVAKMVDGAPQAVFAKGLTSLKWRETALLGSTAPCLVAGALGDAASLVIEAGEKTTVTLAVAAQPAKLTIDGEEQPVQWADGTLTIELAAGRHDVSLQP